MKFKSILLTIAAIGVACGSASGANLLDKDFLDFWSNFKGALQKNDKEALATMTKLPYDFDGQKLNRAAFIKQEEKIFPASVRKRLLKEKPVADKGSVFVFCGDDIYVFSKDNGKYKFTEIGAND